MTTIESAMLFWDVVAATLVELYGFEPADARSRIGKLRGKMTTRAIDRDLTYHWQPLQVAGDIANSFETMTDRQLAVYNAIVERLLVPFAERQAREMSASSKRENGSVAGESSGTLLAAR
jgi:hypothetical protein